MADFLRCVCLLAHEVVFWGLIDLNSYELGGKGVDLEVFSSNIRELRY